MAREIRIDTKGMVKWVFKKWIFMIPAITLIALFVSWSLSTQETKEYEEKIKYLYTADELEERMSETDYRTVERVMATDALLSMRNSELEALSEQEPTEDNLVRQTEVLDEINKLNQLRVSFITLFSVEQSRYYWIKTGTPVTMREDIPKPTGLSGHIVAYSVLGGMIFVVAIMILIYLLVGYLHSKDELELNYGYDVYDVSLKDDELPEKLRFIVKAEGFQNEDDLVVTGAVNWNKEDNQNVKNAILEETHAEFVDRITESVECLESLNEKKILLVERANESKLRRIQDNDLVIRKAKGDVVGVILIS